MGFNIPSLHWRPICFIFGKQQKYSFNSAIYIELILKLFEMFENINKSNIIAKCPKRKSLKNNIMRQEFLGKSHRVGSSAVINFVKLAVEQ